MQWEQRYTKEIREKFQIHINKNIDIYCKEYELQPAILQSTYKCIESGVSIIICYLIRYIKIITHNFVSDDY